MGYKSIFTPETMALIQSLNPQQQTSASSTRPLLELAAREQRASAFAQENQDQIRGRSRAELTPELQALYDRVLMQEGQAGLEPEAPNALNRVIDVLSRINYAVASPYKSRVERQKADGDYSLQEQVSNIPGLYWLDPDNTDVSNDLGQMWEGLTGRSKVVFGDVLNEAYPDMNPVAKFATGLGLDIVTDPTTYLGVGMVSKVAKGAKGGKHLFDAAQEAADTEAIAKRASEVLMRDRRVAGHDPETGALKYEDLPRFEANSPNVNEFGEPVRSVDADPASIAQLINPRATAVEGVRGYKASEVERIQEVQPVIDDTERAFYDRYRDQALEEYLTNPALNGGRSLAPEVAPKPVPKVEPGKTTAPTVVKVGEKDVEIPAPAGGRPLNRDELMTHTRQLQERGGLSSQVATLQRKYGKNLEKATDEERPYLQQVLDDNRAKIDELSQSINDFAGTHNLPKDFIKRVEQGADGVNLRRWRDRRANALKNLENARKELARVTEKGTQQQKYHARKKVEKYETLWDAAKKQYDDKFVEAMTAQLERHLKATGKAAGEVAPKVRQDVEGIDDLTMSNSDRWGRDAVLTPEDRAVTGAGFSRFGTQFLRFDKQTRDSMIYHAIHAQLLDVYRTSVGLAANGVMSDPRFTKMLDVITDSGVLQGMRGPAVNGVPFELKELLKETDDLYSVNSRLDDILALPPNERLLEVQRLAKEISETWVEKADRQALSHVSRSDEAYTGAVHGLDSLTKLKTTTKADIEDEMADAWVDLEQHGLDLDFFRAYVYRRFDLNKVDLEGARATGGEGFLHYEQAVARNADQAAQFTADLERYGLSMDMRRVVGLMDEDEDIIHLFELYRLTHKASPDELAAISHGGNLFAYYEKGRSAGNIRPKGKSKYGSTSELFGEPPKHFISEVLPAYFYRAALLQRAAQRANKADEFASVTDVQGVSLMEQTLKTVDEMNKSVDRLYTPSALDKLHKRDAEHSFPDHKDWVRDDPSEAAAAKDGIANYYTAQSGLPEFMAQMYREEAEQILGKVPRNHLNVSEAEWAGISSHRQSVLNANAGWAHPPSVRSGTDVDTLPVGSGTIDPKATGYKVAKRENAALIKEARAYADAEAKKAASEMRAAMLERFLSNNTVPLERKMQVRFAGQRIAEFSSPRLLNDVVMGAQATKIGQAAVSSFNELFRAGSHLDPFMDAERLRTVGHSNELIAQHAQRLRDSWGQIGAPDRRAALSRVRKGTPVADADRLLLDQMDSLTKRIFSPIVGEGHLSSKELNRWLPEKFRVDPEFISKAALDNVELPKQLLTNGLKKMPDGTDPVELVWQMEIAYEKAIAHRSLTHSLSKTFGVPLEPNITAGKKSWMVKELQTKFGYKAHDEMPGFVFSPEVHTQLDKLFRLLDSPQDLNAFVRFLDDVTGIWKGAVTVYNPGFHIRNSIGDGFTSWIDGVSGTRGLASYRQAARALKDFGGLSELTQQAARHPEPWSQANKTRARTPLFKTRYGKSVSTEELYLLYAQHGLKTGWTNTEFGHHFPGGNSLSASPVGQAARGVNDAVRDASGLREDYFRMAHFIDRIKRSKFRDLNRAAQDAAEAVRKYHFDYTDFTPFEKKYMVRIFPFYKFTRKNLPLMMATLFTNPGKVMAYPKTMNNLSNAMGYDQQGESGLIPGSDVAIPEWVRDRMMWPIYEHNGNTVFADPSNPFQDAMKFIGNPVGNAAQMVTPLAKVPLELWKGETMGSGIPIRDTGEYLLRQHPYGALGTGLADQVEQGNLDGTVSDALLSPRTLQFLLAPGLFENTDNQISGELRRRSQVASERIAENNAMAEQERMIQMENTRALLRSLGIVNG